jgi:hypothetical protein
MNEKCQGYEIKTDGALILCGSAGNSTENSSAVERIISGAAGQ